MYKELKGTWRTVSWRWPLVENIVKSVNLIIACFWPQSSSFFDIVIIFEHLPKTIKNSWPWFTSAKSEEKLKFVPVFVSCWLTQELQKVEVIDCRGFNGWYVTWISTRIQSVWSHPKKMELAFFFLPSLRFYQMKNSLGQSFCLLHLRNINKYFNQTLD